MSLFFVRLSKFKDRIDPFIADYALYMTHKRLQNENILKNPFVGSVEAWQDSDAERVYSLRLDPVYPPIYQFGLMTLLAGAFFHFLLSWSVWVMLPGLLISAPGLLWTFIPAYLALRVSLRKAGYKGRISIMSDKAALRYIVKGKREGIA